MSAARVPAVERRDGSGPSAREVDVPQPRDVTTVGVVVVDGDHHGVRGDVRVQGAQRLPETRPGSSPAAAPPAARRRRRTAPVRTPATPWPARSPRCRRVQAEGQAERGRSAGVLGVVRPLGPQAYRDRRGRRCPAMRSVSRGMRRGRAASSSSTTAGSDETDTGSTAVELLVVGEQLAQLGRDAVVAHLRGRPGGQRGHPLVVAVEHDVTRRGRPRPCRAAGRWCRSRRSGRAGRA